MPRTKPTPLSTIVRQTLKEHGIKVFVLYNDLYSSKTRRIKVQSFTSLTREQVNKILKALKAALKGRDLSQVYGDQCGEFLLYFRKN